MNFHLVVDGFALHILLYIFYIFDVFFCVFGENVAPNAVRAHAYSLINSVRIRIVMDLTVVMGVRGRT